MQMNASVELDVKEVTPIVPPPVYPLHAADPHAQGAVEVPEAPAGRDHQGPVAVCPVDAASPAGPAGGGLCERCF